MSQVLILDPTKVGRRIWIVRKLGAGLSGRALAQQLGSTDQGLTAKLEAGKAISYPRMQRIAEVCAGKGVLRRTTSDEILAFLEGRIDELPSVLDGDSTQMSYFRQNSQVAA